MCKWLPIATSGPIMFFVLLIKQGRPISYAYVAADGNVWSDYFFEKFPWCNRVGPWHMRMWLPIATPRLIVFLEDVANAIGWAYRICACGC